jgi:hypothetical protein
MNKLAQAAGRDVVKPRSLVDDLEQSGATEIGGYELHRELYESMVGRSLDDARLAPDLSLQVVQFGRSLFSPGLSRAADRWEAADVAVTRTVISESEVWWFAPDDVDESERPVTVEAIERTVAWLGSVATPEARGWA